MGWRAPPAAPHARWFPRRAPTLLRAPCSCASVCSTQLLGAVHEMLRKHFAEASVAVLNGDTLGECRGAGDCCATRCSCAAEGESGSPPPALTPTLACLPGALAAAQRHQLVRRMESGSLQVLLMSQAGSHGINLVSCRRIALLDESWNPVFAAQVWVARRRVRAWGARASPGWRSRAQRLPPPPRAQAIARIWRYGQQRRCFVYRVYYNGTCQVRGERSGCCGGGALGARAGCALGPAAHDAPPFAPLAAPPPHSTTSTFATPRRWLSSSAWWTRRR